MILLGVGTSVQAACSEARASLRGDFGSVGFSVEVARTAEEQARGLMHRDSLGRFSGMLFVYPSPREVAFWMRNTLIPLDLLFIDAQGEVAHIHAEAKPLDETPIPSEGDVIAVLEINGGMARKLGLGLGDDVQHPDLPQDLVVWPCPE